MFSCWINETISPQMCMEADPVGSPRFEPDNTSTTK